MDTKLRTKANKDFEKYFFKLMNNCVFEKIWKIKGSTETSKLWQLANKETIQRWSLTSIQKILLRKSGGDWNEQNKCRNEEASIFRSINSGHMKGSNAWVLVWLYKLKYGDNTKLCCMDTDSFIAHVKLEDVYEDLVGDVEKRFCTLNYKLKRHLPIGKKRKK